MEKDVDREKLVQDTGKYTYDFRTFNTIRTFGEDIYDGEITLEEADEDQTDLADKINEFTKEERPKLRQKTRKKNCYKKLPSFS